jgi:hypothetical protein
MLSAPDIPLLPQECPSLLRILASGKRGGKWRMENGEWGMENGEWGMENGEWGMEN